VKEFYDQMVELVLAVRTPTELAREFEPTANAIRGWVKQAAVDAGESPEGLTSSERDETAAELNDAALVGHAQKGSWHMGQSSVLFP